MIIVVSSSGQDPAHLTWDLHAIHSIKKLFRYTIYRYTVIQKLENRSYCTK